MREAKNLVFYFGLIVAVPHFVILYILPSIDSAPLTPIIGLKLFAIFYFLIALVASHLYYESSELGEAEIVLWSISLCLVTVNMVSLPSSAAAIYGEHFQLRVNFAVLVGCLTRAFPFLFPHA